MAHYCGFDFGTSNTVVTVVDDGGRTRAVVADASLLFLPDSGAQAQERFVGSEAVERYVGSGMNGRFIQSLKSLLPDSAFRGTDIHGKRYSVEDLVSMILSYFKRRLESELGEPVNRAVFGRPVRFSDDPTRDDLAEERLRAAAQRCGFSEIVFCPEPVAAADRVRGAVERGVTVLVGDYGGGTSDFSVVTGDTDGPARVAATHGVRVGGDDFDGEIMWHRLVPYFGYGSEYESYGKMLPVPVHIYRTLMRWDRIAFLKTAQYRDDLRYIHSGANDRVAIEWLSKLIDEDLGFALFQMIRAAKHSLSTDQSAAIAFFERGIELKERVYRDEFQEFIAKELERLDLAVDRVLDAAGVTDDGIGCLLLTGGSSFVRAIRSRLSERFPAAVELEGVDRFATVSMGLASRARELEIATS